MVKSLEKGLIGHWSYEAETFDGGLFTDMSAYDRHVSTSSTEGIADGIVGENCYESADHNDALISSKYIEIPQKYSICEWYNGLVEDQPGDNIYSAGWDRKVATTLQNTSQTIRGGMLIRNQADDGYHSVYNGDNFLNGEWNHFAATVDRDTLEVKIYKNGSNIHTETIPDHYSGEQRFVLGAWNTSSYGSVYGKIDDTRIYDRVLSTEEIDMLYQIRNQPRKYT